MSTNKFYQLVDIPDARYSHNETISYGDIACDCETKTTSILEAINFISLSLSTKSESDKAELSEIGYLTCIIADLAELGIATNKISSSAYYSSGYLDGKNDN